jgi:hypothetical protein
MKILNGNEENLYLEKKVTLSTYVLFTDRVYIKHRQKNAQ